MTSKHRSATGLCTSETNYPQCEPSAGTAQSASLPFSQLNFWLENRSYIEARPRSGFYVRIPFSELVPEPQFRHRESIPRNIELLPTLEELLEAANDVSKTNLGASFPNADLFPTAKLNKIIRRITYVNPYHSSRYHFPPGDEVLRQQIAKRSLEFGCSFSPDEIVVTSGAIEAIALSLRAVASSGDVVAVEVPVHFGVLQQSNR